MKMDMGFPEYFAKEIERLEQLYDERDRRYEERFKSSDERTALALTASEKAVTKAETATEKRFDGVNEFRGALRDQADKLLPRAEAEARLIALDAKLEQQAKLIVILQQQWASALGKGAGANALWGYIIGAVGLASIILSIIFRFVQ